MGFELAFYATDHRLIALVMVVILGVVCELGFRAGSRRRDAADSYRSLVNGIGAAMFGLLGLLLAFTLSMAIGRWDARRDVLVAESNAIGTLHLRAGLFEQPVRDELRGALREYLDSRVALAESGGHLEAYRAARLSGELLHQRIWSAVEQAGNMDISPAKLSSLISAANELIDIHELRLAAIENFLPASLFVLQVGVAAVALFFLAWSFGAAEHGRRVSILLLGLLIASILLMIMDINRPQRGAFAVGVDTLERTRDAISETEVP